jgi:hypothetical protein
MLFVSGSGHFIDPFDLFLKYGCSILRLGELHLKFTVSAIGMFTLVVVVYFQLGVPSLPLEGTCSVSIRLIYLFSQHFFASSQFLFSHERP